MCGSGIHLNENFWEEREMELKRLEGKGKGTKTKKRGKKRTRTRTRKQKMSQKARTDLERRLQIGRYVGIGNVMVACGVEDGLSKRKKI